MTGSFRAYFWLKSDVDNLFWSTDCFEAAHQVYFSKSCAFNTGIQRLYWLSLGFEIVFSFICFKHRKSGILLLLWFWLKRGSRKAEETLTNWQPVRWDWKQRGAESLNISDLMHYLYPGRGSWIFQGALGWMVSFWFCTTFVRVCVCVCVIGGAMDERQRWKQKPRGPNCQIHLLVV